MRLLSANKNKSDEEMSAGPLNVIEEEARELEKSPDKSARPSIF